MHKNCVPAGASSDAVASGSDPSTAAVAADVDLVWQEEDMSMVGTCEYSLVLSVLRLSCYLLLTCTPALKHVLLYHWKLHMCLCVES